MKKSALTVFATALAIASGTAESMKISVLENAVLCVRASHVPDNVTDQVRATSLPSRLAGTVLDLRFADSAGTNAADFFIHRREPLIILVNSETRGSAASLAAELRSSAPAILIGNTNSPVNLTPDITVAVGQEQEKKFQDNPFLSLAAATNSVSPATNSLLAFVDHTSEADLVRKRVKDGEQDSDMRTPRAEPPQPVIQDPALSRAVDILKALAALHPARG